MSKLGKTLLIGTALGVGYIVFKVRRARAASAMQRSRQQDERVQPAPSEPMTAEPAPTEPPVAPPAAGAPESGTWPETPLPEPIHPNLRQRINHCTRTRDDTVRETPEELLQQARRHDPSITLDELTGARLAASEHNRGSFTELCCIVESELERAKRRGVSLFESLTYQRTFGPQDAHRPASTRLDPTIRHLLAAREVLSGRARGVARGAIMFFDPATQEKHHRTYRAWLEKPSGVKPKVHSCDALTLLEAWSFDYAKRHEGGNRCPPDRSRPGKDTLAWVGEIPGVDAAALMLMQPMPAGPEHTGRYEAARDYLRRALAVE